MAAWSGITRSCGRGASAGSPGEPYPGTLPTRDPLESPPPSTLLQVLRLDCVPSRPYPSPPSPPIPDPRIPGSRTSSGVGVWVRRSGFCPKCHFKG